MKKQAVLLLAVAGILFTGGNDAQAFDWFGGRLSIGGGYGRAKPELPYSYKDGYQDGTFWTANLKYFINNDFSLVGSYGDLEPYARGNNQDFYRFKPVVVGFRYNIFHHIPISPYLTAGAGYSWNSHQYQYAVEDKWKDWTIQAGVGFEFFITEGFSLGAEALYHNFVRQNVVPYRLATLAGMGNVYFGAGPTERRAEEAAKREKDTAEKAIADANASKQQALQAQQQALSAQQAAGTAQQGQAAAQAQVLQATTTAAAAQQEAADAQAKLAQLQQQRTQEQAELDNIKQMIAHKDISAIEFKTGSSDLLATSNATLDKVAGIIKKYPDLQIRIEGHTDNVGNENYNQQLSQKRGDSVKSYLVSTGGVNGDQVTSLGMGKGGPIADNSTASGRAKNRRVEFIVTTK